jgi:hypothetical protein
MLEQDERLEGEVRLKAAVAAYSKGLELRPTDVLLLIKRGWAWDGLGQGDKALADFQAALRQEPNNAEAHAGLGYLRAVAKLPAGAQQEADLALLHGADLPPERRYLILHNVACIYAKRAQADARQATAYQDAAIAPLRQAIDLWKWGGGPSEIQLIEGGVGVPARAARTAGIQGPPPHPGAVSLRPRVLPRPPPNLLTGQPHRVPVTCAPWSMTTWSSASIKGGLFLFSPTGSLPPPRGYVAQEAFVATAPGGSPKKPRSCGRDGGILISRLGRETAGQHDTLAARQTRDSRTRARSPQRMPRRDRPTIQICR